MCFEELEQQTAKRHTERERRRRRQRQIERDTFVKQSLQTWSKCLTHPPGIGTPPTWGWSLGANKLARTKWSQLLWSDAVRTIHSHRVPEVNFLFLCVWKPPRLEMMGVMFDGTTLSIWSRKMMMTLYHKHRASVANNFSHSQADVLHTAGKLTMMAGEVFQKK